MKIYILSILRMVLRLRPGKVLAIRLLAIGRKNYMFYGNHDAAEKAAVMYSLLGSCKACDVNPREWLTDVQSRIPKYNNDYSVDLAELLLHRWNRNEVELMTKGNKAPENLQKITE